MTPHEEKLNELFAKYEKDYPGTAYFEALCDFSRGCFDTVKTQGDSLQIKDIHSFIAAAYRTGFNRGYAAGRYSVEECNVIVEASSTIQEGSD